MVPRDEEILDMLAEMRKEQQEHRCETSKSFADLDKKVDLHIQKTEYELKAINHQDEVQNKLLEEHIEGVNTLKKIHEEHVKENNTRFSKLEAPRKFIKSATRLLLWAGGIGASITGIVEAYRFLKGL